VNAAAAMMAFGEGWQAAGGGGHAPEQPLLPTTDMTGASSRADIGTATISTVMGAPPLLQGPLPLKLLRSIRTSSKTTTGGCSGGGGPAGEAMAEPGSRSPERGGGAMIPSASDLLSDPSSPTADCWWTGIILTPGGGHQGTGGSGGGGGPNS